MLKKNNYQNKIKQFRVREGLTQDELAKKINISRQMIGLIENKNNTIRRNSFKIIYSSKRTYRTSLFICVLNKLK